MKHTREVQRIYDLIQSIHNRCEILLEIPYHSRIYTLLEDIAEDAHELLELCQEESDESD